jgi:hypothetical protein
MSEHRGSHWKKMAFGSLLVVFVASIQTTATATNYHEYRRSDASFSTDTRHCNCRGTSMPRSHSCYTNHKRVYPGGFPYRY